jgi:LPXTG-motif cell wall-anchored protein
VSIASSTVGDTGALANTGPPAGLVWIVIFGAGLLLVGSFGRWQVQRARR